MDWEFGVNRCKLVYTEWISNKALLHSTGKYIQSPVINCNGKVYEKECVCVCVCVCVYITESLTYIADINILNQLCFSLSASRISIYMLIY